MKATSARLLLVAFCWLFSLALAACGTQGAASSDQPVEAQPTIQPTAVVQIADEALAAVAEEPDHCLSCHTDKDRLIRTEDPVVEVESENSGAG